MLGLYISCDRIGIARFMLKVALPIDKVHLLVEPVSLM